MANERPKPLLRDVDPRHWADVLASDGHPPYRGRQLAHWLYAQTALDWPDMTTLPRRLRDELATRYDVAGLSLLERLVGSDGTRKFLFQLRDGQTVESVIIPMQEHATFCISSQVGCAMACRFCATARGGLVRNLTRGEIIEQVQRLRLDLVTDPFPQHGDRQHNVVFMGMGEPLDNFDAVAGAIETFVASDGLGMSVRRIQISTSGPPAGLARLGRLRHAVGLTISLGGADDDARRKLMPVSGRADVATVLAAAEKHAQRMNRRVTVAWILIEGRTDAPEQAQQLASHLARRPFKVNLIPLNALDDDTLRAPGSARVLAFEAILKRADVPVTIRVSGGRDIAAACGQLRRRRMVARDGVHARDPAGPHAGEGPPDPPR